jgi:nicotinate-nucleotide pyrophosphorylase
MAQAAQQISVVEVDGRINALVEQRNEAQNRVVYLSGVVTFLQARVKELEEAASAKPEPVV